MPITVDFVDLSEYLTSLLFSACGATSTTPGTKVLMTTWASVKRQAL
jgi:hypothetical protein